MRDFGLDSLGARLLQLRRTDLVFRYSWDPGRPHPSCQAHGTRTAARPRWWLSLDPSSSFQYVDDSLAKLGKV